MTGEFTVSGVFHRHGSQGRETYTHGMKIVPTHEELRLYPNKFTPLVGLGDAPPETPPEAPARNPGKQPKSAE